MISYVWIVQSACSSPHSLKNLTPPSANVVPIVKFDVIGWPSFSDISSVWCIYWQLTTSSVCHDIINACFPLDHGNSQANIMIWQYTDVEQIPLCLCCNSTWLMLKKWQKYILSFSTLKITVWSLIILQIWKYQIPLHIIYDLMFETIVRLGPGLPWFSWLHHIWCSTQSIWIMVHWLHYAIFMGTTEEII